MELHHHRDGAPDRGAGIMTPFSILATNLTTQDAKLLAVALRHVGLPTPAPVPALDATRFVLSVGKAGLEVWHDFGLVQVSANHGDVFTHRAASGRTYTIMQLLHPGAMQQMSITHHSAREDMVRDLERWRMVLGGAGGHGFFPPMCGGCQKSKRTIRVMPAEHWVPELDGVGLCDDHYRRRSQYRRKEPRVSAKGKSKMEHQVPGQLEMLPGDGTQVRVSKG